eukprot:scaffold26116_cov74-Phaeocystis_antarctica.AAC.2
MLSRPGLRQAPARAAAKRYSPVKISEAPGSRSELVISQGIFIAIHNLGHVLEFFLHFNTLRPDCALWLSPSSVYLFCTACVVISSASAPLLWVVAPCPRGQGQARRPQEQAPWLRPQARSRPAHLGSAPVPANLQMARGWVRSTGTRPAAAVREHVLVLARQARRLAGAAERAHRALRRRGRGAARHARTRRRLRQLDSCRQWAHSRLPGPQGHSAPSSAAPWVAGGTRPQQAPLARSRSLAAW